MSDVAVVEPPDEEEEGEAVLEEEEYREEDLGEDELTRLYALTEPSLKSDFCPEEPQEEEYGEQSWVCHEYEIAGEDKGEYDFYETELQPEEEEEITPEQKKTLDSEYLKAVLGAPLTFALLEIATRRPTDPIQYLGHYLLKWRWCQIDTQQCEEQMKELNKEREAYLAKLKEQERQNMLAKEEKEEELRRAEKVESSLDEDEYGEGGKYLGDGE